LPGPTILWRKRPTSALFVSPISWGLAQPGAARLNPGDQGMFRHFDIPANSYRWQQFPFYLNSITKCNFELGD
jgi:hypothetical protein